jgi:DNA topoisomerase-3
MTEEDLKKKPAAKKPAAKKPAARKAPASDPMVGKPCPLCGKGVIIKGKTAYGCSNWKAGCQYRQPFSQM